MANTNPIPSGHGRVVQNGPKDHWITCSCGSAVTKTQSSFLLWCDLNMSGCGAEWDYQAVQNATIGTDLPSKQTAAILVPNVAPVGMHIIKSYNQLGVAALYKGTALGWQCEDCNALRTGKSTLMSSGHTVHSVECIGCKNLWDDRDLAATLGSASVPTVQLPPIVKPYARVHTGQGGNYLHCSCGRTHTAPLPAFSANLQCPTHLLEWLDADVQAASVGDLLPGTPIGQKLTAAQVRVGQAVKGPPVLFDPFDTPGPEAEPTTDGGKKCWDCGGDWCEALDSWFGDKMYAGTCAPCRSKRGIKG